MDTGNPTYRLSCYYRIFFTVLIYMDFSDSKEVVKSDETKDDNTSEQQEEKEIVELSDEKFKNKEDTDKLNPFGDPYELDQLTDAYVQDYIHQMAHQKVIANEKWGFYRITDERISWLLEGVQSSDLNHKQTYLNILNQWQQGNFAEADVHHNTIWELQGGTIGKATGVYSQEEEQAFLESYENQ